MDGGTISVPMVVRSMIGKSWGQGAQHSQGLHSMFMHVPGLKVVAPSNAYDAKGCMIAAIRDDNPVIFVEHRLLYPTKGSTGTGASVGFSSRCSTKMTGFSSRIAAIIQPLA